MKKIFTRIWITTATVVIIVMAAVLICLLTVVEFVRGLKIADPFHDSRRHPLNDPSAPRG